MNDAIKRPLNLPDLLYTEGEDLRIVAAYVLPVAPGLRQWPARPLGQHHNLRRQVGRFLNDVRRVALAIQAASHGADTNHSLTVDEERFHRKSRKDVDAECLGL